VPEIELGTVLKLETVGTVLELGTMGKVLEPLPELVPGQGTKPETMPELKLEAETEQGNKYSALHPWAKVL
jgi:hypothetical protein